MIRLPFMAEVWDTKSSDGLCARRLVIAELPNGSVITVKMSKEEYEEIISGEANLEDSEYAEISHYKYYKPFLVEDEDD